MRNDEEVEHLRTCMDCDEFLTLHRNGPTRVRGQEELEDLSEEVERNSVLHRAINDLWTASSRIWSQFQREQTVAYQQWKRREREVWLTFQKTVGPFIGGKKYQKPIVIPSIWVSDEEKEFRALEKEPLPTREEIAEMLNEAESWRAPPCTTCGESIPALEIYSDGRGGLYHEECQPYRIDQPHRHQFKRTGLGSMNFQPCARFECACGLFLNGTFNSQEDRDAFTEFLGIEIPSVTFRGQELTKLPYVELGGE